MATTSNTYLFGTNTQLDDLFREAYERIGIIGNEQTPLNIQSAIMSANFELSSWPGKGLNLWLIQREMFTLYPNQPIYSLPLNTVRVLEVAATQPIRLNIGGTAASSNGGNASNCFDPNQIAGCIQNAPNGNISYDYGINNSYSILYVGITPLNTSTYTLVVEYSFDNINWTTVYTAPSQTYSANQITWFVIEKSLNARAWRIRETGGATLQIQQIYFDQPTVTGTGDRLLSPLSRSEYVAISTKMTTGFPSGYYFDQTISPSMVLWPVPSINNPSTTILYTNYRYAQDVTQMFQSVEVPQRFYDALVAGLSARLAMKFAPDRYPLMKGEAVEAYYNAGKTDFENVKFRFNPDFTPYGG
jgi:hypothetical protein